MKLKSGDIFEFSINENSKSYGQIICLPDKQTLVIVIFEGQFKSRPLIDEIVNCNILFLGITFDAKLYNKHWVLIGNNTDNLANVQLPYYKLGTDKIFIETFDKRKIREATQEEIDVLNYRTVFSPVAFELALKAYYHQIEWTDRFDKLLYSNVINANRLINNSKICS